jgi:hypothetical protein
MMAKLLEVKQNFDWEETQDKKLVVFMPNHAHSQLTEFAIQQIRTRVDKKDYLLVIGNDNVDYNWDHLCNLNVRSFTLIHDNEGPRNGAFIRNYFLKRNKSEITMQKDGEVIVTNDFIYRVINCHTPWRAGKIWVVPEHRTKDMLEVTGGVNWTLEHMPMTHLVTPMIAENAYHAKEIIALADGKVNPSTYFHYAYAAPTKVLQNIGGYDEDYKTYGWEDADMFCRLYHMGTYLTPDAGCAAVHPWHPRATDCAPEQLLEMRQLFITKSPGDPFRNRNREWGEGV